MKTIFYQKLGALMAILIASCGLSRAQSPDPQFSQYYSLPLYLNQGFAGLTPHQRLVVNHRVQWPNLPQAFSTYAFSYDIFSNELRSGFGIMAMTDKMGSGALKTTSVQGVYSYKVKLNDNWVFSPGVSFGYGAIGIDREKLAMYDELEYGGGGPGSQDPRLAALGNEDYFDLGSGFVMYNKMIWWGMSAHHLNRPNVSLSDVTDRLSPKLYVHGGMKIPLAGPYVARGARINYLSPSFVYRWQGEFSQMDMGVNYHVDPVMVGIWYRGIPFVKNVFDNPTRDALVFMFGVQFSQFQFGYSYDFTISELETTTGGSHEISLIYEFVGRFSKDKVKRKDKFIPCPTFHRKDNFWN
jgi:type IX secretion system PorP/SprF family membrane protein